MGDAHAPRRRLENMEPETRRAVASASGKALLKKRGEKLERSFAHVLDIGGLRSTTLRGLAGINKRYLCGVMAFNLSLILRKLTGVGTLRQAAAALIRLWELFSGILDHLLTRIFLQNRGTTNQQPA